MNHDRRGGAQRRGDLVFVSPAAVVGHRLAAEHLRVQLAILLHRRVIDQHHDGLALDVDAGVVVPVIFRGLHAVAHEHHGAVLDADLGLVVGGHGHCIVREIQRQALLADLDMAPRGATDARQRHGLQIAAVRIARLQAQRLELLLQVRHGLATAGGARHAALVFVGGQLADMRHQLLAADAGGGFVDGAGLGRRRLGLRGFLAAEQQACGNGQAQQAGGGCACHLQLRIRCVRSIIQPAATITSGAAGNQLIRRRNSRWIHRQLHRQRRSDVR